MIWGLSLIILADLNSIRPYSQKSFASPLKGKRLRVHASQDPESQGGVGRDHSVMVEIQLSKVMLKIAAILSFRLDNFDFHVTGFSTDLRSVRSVRERQSGGGATAVDSAGRGSARPAGHVPDQQGPLPVLFGEAADADGDSDARSASAGNGAWRGEAESQPPAVEAQSRSGMSMRRCRLYMRSIMMMNGLKFIKFAFL